MSLAVMRSEYKAVNTVVTTSKDFIQSAYIFSPKTKYRSK